MIDDEIDRLRRLRARALRVRAVARALDRLGPSRREPCAARAQHAAWRIARGITGHLRAHPYEKFQQGAGLGIVLGSGITGVVAAVLVRRPEQASARLRSELTHLARELDDARAVTRSAELSDSFGRSQLEMRALFLELQPPTGERSDALGATADAPLTAAGVGAGDWPYLAM